MKVNPAVLPRLSAHRLFRHATGEETWILGDLAADRYLTVPGRSLAPVQRATQLLDGTRSVEEVAARVRAELKAELDVAELTRLLSQAGLLLGADGQPRRSSQPALPGWELLSVDFQTLGRGIQSRLRPARLLFALAIGLFALFLWAVARSGALASWPGTAAASILTIVGSMLLHEAGHAVAARRAGLSPRALTFALYFGFIPMMYLRIPGVYTVPPVARIRIWSAGCLVNLTIAGAAALAGVFAPEGGEIVGFAITWNLALVKLNLLPFLPTDGYFILSTLLGEHNLRAQAHQVIRGWLRGRRGTVRWCVGLYAIGTILLVGRLAMRFADWLIGQLPAERAVATLYVSLLALAAGLVLRHRARARDRVAVAIPGSPVTAPPAPRRGSPGLT